jgi:hypothetical protein
MSPESSCPEVAVVGQERQWRIALKEDLKMLASKLKLNKWLLHSKLIISNFIATGAHNLEPILPLNSLEELEAAPPMPSQALRTCQSIVQFAMSDQEPTTFLCPMQDPQLRQK